jgi:hypothetical protein
VIKKLMSLGEMATLTQTLSDDAIQVLADEFKAGRDRPRGRRRRGRASSTRTPRRISSNAHRW